MKDVGVVLLFCLACLLATACGDGNAGHGVTDQRAVERIMAITFNLRTGPALDGADSWLFRKGIVREFVDSEQPAILGTQEGWAFQLDFIKETVLGYEWVGRSRYGSSFEEHCAVFYRADRFTLVDSGTFWLSDTPDQPGTKFSPSQNFPRIATWAELRGLDTGCLLFFFNTHLDTYTGEQVHERSAALLARQMEAIAAGAPVLLTGDFNEPVGGPAYQILTGESEFDGVRGKLIDPWQSLRLAEEGTFHGFDGVANGPSRIDWILGSEQFTPLSGEVSHYQKEGRYPSDHFPAVAAFDLAPE